MGDSVVALDSLVLETSRDAIVGAWWFETVIAGTEWDPEAIGLHLIGQVVRTSWTELTRVHMQPKCCPIWSHPSHIVSVVLLTSMASCRQVHTISRFVCMGC